MSNVIHALGGPSAVARILGIKAPSVCGWGDRPPPDRCPALERASAGRVACEEMRPDIRWSRIPDPDWPHPAGRPVIDPAKTDADAEVDSASPQPTAPDTVPPPEPSAWPLATDRRIGPRSCATEPAPALPRAPLTFDGDDRGMRDAA